MKAIEESFIPLCIYNNTQGGHDAEILKRFKEPAWNNPVVRIVSPETGEDIARQIRTDWSRAALVEEMIRALESQKKEIPESLAALRKKKQ